MPDYGLQRKKTATTVQGCLFLPWSKLELQKERGEFGKRDV